jgi:sarcosine oxidase subunit gamma
MVERRSALAEVHRPGTYGAAAPDGPGVAISERRPLAIVHVAGDAPAFVEAVKQVAGIEPPLAPNTAAQGADCAVLWLAPDRWLVVSAKRTPEELARALAAAVGDTGAVTDVSSGSTVFRLAGARVRDALAKGCPLDLDASVFRPGCCAGTLIGPVNALLQAVDEGRIDLYVARGFGLHVWEWLIDAAAEYGYRVEPAGGS